MRDPAMTPAGTASGTDVHATSPDPARILADAAELARTGRLADAIALLVPAVRQAPTHGPLASALTDLFEATRALPEAIATLQAFVQAAPEAAEGWHRLAGLLPRVGEQTAALDAARRAVALRAAWAPALNRLGCLLSPASPDAARDAFRRAIAAEPRWVAPALNLARSLRDHGEGADAVAVLRAAARHAPDDATLRAALAEALLEHGAFADGWREYAWRFDCGGAVPAFPGTQAPVWDGEPLGGRIAMVWLEQGLGDQLQFCRYLPGLAAAGGRIWLQAPPSLRPLLATLGVVERFVDEGEVPAGFDVQIPLLSLPHALRARQPDIPMAPYLSAPHAPSDAVAAWRDTPPGTLRVGLVHASRPDHPSAARRDCPLALFRPLSTLPGVALHSLQFGEAGAAAARAQDWPIVDLSPVLGDFARTAAIVHSLDLVITVDTAMAHLCGALGRPVWTLLSTPCDWRWQYGRADSPWYPSMRLYRQRVPGDWSTPLAAIAGDLAALAATRTMAEA